MSQNNRRAALAQHQLRRLRALERRTQMLTKYTVYRPGELPEEHELQLKPEPSLDELQAIVRPHLPPRHHMERVNVFWDGDYTDMFVSELGAVEGLEVNTAASVIYRNNWLVHQDPTADPESLPAVYGPAVLFGRRVWF